MNRTTSTRTTECRRKPGEDGFILLAVIILLALFVIAMAVAAPRIAASIQRDREVETMERGKQYIRAIQLYYRKFNAYPPNIEALVKTNDIRFLRKRYKDPMTGKDDWKPIYFGQNKQPIAYGFFGQPLGGTGGAVIAGTGPSGGNGYPGASTPGAGGGMFPGSSGSSPSPTGGLFGGQSGSGTPQPGQTGDQGSNGTNGSTGTTDANGTPLNGQQFGGGGIIGFEPASPKKSILTYKKKNKYNEWEFTYSPMMDQQMMQGGNTGGVGAPVGGPGVGGPGVGGPGVGGPGVGGPGVGGPGVGGPGVGGPGGSTPIAPPGMPSQPQ